MPTSSNYLESDLLAQKGAVSLYRVVVVDDEHLIRSSLSNKISLYSDTTIVSGTAGNGVKALEWLETHYADWCITDVRMPVMDGLELIKQINERYPWMHCMVVSSYDDFSYAKESIQLGAHDYILKPIDQSMLNQALERMSRETHQARHNEAVDLLLRKLPHYRKVMDQWVEHLQTLQMENMPLLVVDTLDMLEEWTGETYYLLNPLAMAWLQMVGEELKKEKIEISLHEGKDLGLGEPTIPHHTLRRYFRLGAVRRLEEGVQRLFQSSKEAKDNPTRKAVDEVKAYIHENFAEKLSLQQMADQVCMSRNYFANVFKQETGTTIWSYLVTVRMQRARELLLQSNLRIYQIAAEVGYDNNVHFSQVFKEHYGLTPMEYKKRMESF